MLRNYFKIAWRNLAKHKFISFINLFGLTVGLTCCLLILAYVLNELSYDRYNSRADRIYRVTRSFLNKDGVQSLHLSSIAPPFAPLLKNDFPDIQQITRVLPSNTTPMRYKDNIFNEQKAFFVDEHFADLFDVHTVAGDPKTALEAPFSLMLTEGTARKYFGPEDPMNKVIRVNNQFDCKVTGIFKEFPANAHMHPEVMISFNTLRDSAIYGENNLLTNYGNNAFYTYFLVPENYPVHQRIEAQFPAFIDKNVHFPGAPSDFKPSKTTRLFVQKLTDIHLRSHLDDELEENGDITRVYIFGSIALFILLIACINYMNLSTARSALRAREIGIRKVAGAERKELILQFLSESVMIAWIAILLAIGLTWLTLPWLNELTGGALSLAPLFQGKLLIPLILTPILVGVLSGIYPALFMSSFQPVKVLKGLFKAGGGSISFRKVLVVVQFSISIILIISTAIVFQQLDYIRQKSLGFNKDHIITMQYDTGLDKTWDAFRNQLLQSAYVKDAGRSSRIPGGRLLDEMGASVESGDSLRPVTADIKYLAADYDFVPTYGISVVAGRNFSRAWSTDSSAAYLLNVAATRVLDLKSPAAAIGKNFSYGNTKGKIVGVLGDFHFESLHQKILPMVLVLPRASQTAGSFGRISIKLAGNNLPAALTYLESAWKRFLPTTPFEYEFMDKQFGQLYASEQRQASLFTTFACIAIFIACLGLLGLSAFAISQRVKEIGIRKVLGANVSGIVMLLSRDFMILVALAAVIGSAVAAVAMNKWLGGFAYSISMSLWVFLGAAILAAAVALVTIGVQAVRVATSNPVKSLRSE
ncbi:MAG: ABC transporter permease [Bacteroidota bacterium]|nr:ABC transporter permease [Bacteroidota bacterium]MDP4258794.1 ABC transporter permease [Bacteroidota bacterium]